MTKFKFGSVVVLSVALWAQGAMAAEGLEQEQALRQTMQDAVWPGDIVKAAERYEASYPQGAWVDAAHSLKARAQASLKVLARKDIMVYTSTVSQLTAQSDVGAMARQALLGDGEAARILAHRAVKPESGRYVGWLQWATALGNNKAAYELALHFRKQDQPLLASQYEARAVALGYEPPSTLDHLRR